MGALSRNKGNRVEREIVNLHRKMRIDAERVPLSGAQRYQGNGEDVDVYVFGRTSAPLCCQVKAYKGTRGTKGILDALNNADALFIRYDAEPGQQALPPVVVVSWATWERLVKAVL